MSRRKRNRAKLNINETNKEETKMGEHVEGSAADWTEIRKLPVGILQVDAKYQRAYNPKWAQEIADTFQIDLLETLHVSKRNGQYFVFDGQHRMNAVKIRFKNDNYPITCKIYHGLSMDEEAKLFKEINTRKKKMTSADLFKSQAIYDEDTKDFLKHTRAAGFLIDPAKPADCRYGIKAMKKARTLYDSLGIDTYNRMLSLLRETWDGEQWSVTQRMLGGMGVFLKMFGSEVDDQKFISQMKKVTQTMLETEANRFQGVSVSVAYASAIAKFYNKGLRSGRLNCSLLLVTD